MNATVNLAVALLVLAMAAGCSPTDVGEAPLDIERQQVEDGPEGMPPKVEAFAWDCEDGRYVVSQYDAEDDLTWLFLPGQTVRLPHLPSASGARFGNDEVSFWSKGDEAMLEGEGASTNCVLNRFRSNMESIKLSGGDFWAVGNEPGWTVEIYPDWIVFTTDYGERTMQAKISDHSEDPSTQPYVFTGQSGDDELTVELSSGPCHDSMSGEAFETAVVVELDGKRYTGCGQALH